MRKKVTLEVDDSTGMIYDETGIYIGTKLGVRGFEPEVTRLSIAEIIKLKDAGFSADEIVILNKEGVV